MDENWVRYGLAKLGQISELPNWQRMLFCAYTTQLLHSTGEVCWNNKDSYFVWFEFVCRNSGQIASRRSWKWSCLGVGVYLQMLTVGSLVEPNLGEHDVQFTCGVDIVRNDMYSERCVSLVFLFWGEVGKFRSSRVVPRERVGSPKSESLSGKII